MRMRETLQMSPKRAIALTLAGALAFAGSVFAMPGQAQANHRWVAPAIAGLIIGGILYDQAYRHQYRRHYAYDPYPRYAYPRHKHRRVMTYGYPGPVLQPYWGPPVYYRHHRPGIYFSW